jgi:hypothetical protein
MVVMAMPQCSEPNSLLVYLRLDPLNSRIGTWAVGVREVISIGRG